jgi:hypothetical protein
MDLFRGGAILLMPRRFCLLQQSRMFMAFIFFFLFFPLPLRYPEALCRDVIKIWHLHKILIQVNTPFARNDQIPTAFRYIYNHTLTTGWNNSVITSWPSATLDAIGAAAIYSICSTALNG